MRAPRNSQGMRRKRRGRSRSTRFNPPTGVEAAPSPNFSIHRCFKEFSAAHESISPSSTTRFARARNSVKLKSRGLGVPA
ncbi:UNVERIFIED_CONTAM: hypothetical protein Slati_3739200 [Sesamum latifolium]|uniref:Uncharacterized protein n=1 Tax=Sesamum latifolium TaxID=2727402 RepID=A0AAW2U4Q4_9LAMI